MFRGKFCKWCVLPLASDASYVRWDFSNIPWKRHRTACCLCSLCLNFFGKTIMCGLMAVGYKHLLCFCLPWIQFWLFASLHSDDDARVWCKVAHIGLAVTVPECAALACPLQSLFMHLFCSCRAPFFPPFYHPCKCQNVKNETTTTH